MFALTKLASQGDQNGYALQEENIKPVITGNKITFNIPKTGDICCSLILHSPTERVACYVDSQDIAFHWPTHIQVVQHRQEPQSKIAKSLFEKNILPKNFYDMDIPEIVLLKQQDVNLVGQITCKTDNIKDVVIFCKYKLLAQNDRIKLAETPQYSVKFNQHIYKSFYNFTAKDINISNFTSLCKHLIIWSQKQLQTLELSINGIQSSTTEPEYYRTVAPYMCNLNPTDNDLFVYYIPIDFSYANSMLKIRSSEATDVYITGIFENTLVFGNGYVQLKYMA